MKTKIVNLTYNFVSMDFNNKMINLHYGYGSNITDVRGLYAMGIIGIITMILSPIIGTTIYLLSNSIAGLCTAGGLFITGFSLCLTGFILAYKIRLV